MKTFRLVHVLSELEVGETMIIHYGGHIVQASNLIRKEDKE